MSVSIKGKWSVGTEVAPSAPSSMLPPERTLTVVTPKPLAQPAYLQSVIDDTFGYQVKYTKVTTNSADFGSPALPYSLEPGYSKTQPWNFDGTLMRIGRQYSLNGNTYVFDHKIAGSSYHGLWSNTRADRLWQFATAGAIYVYDPFAKVRTLWFDFGTLSGFTFDASTMGVGNYEGNIDNNDKFVMLNFKRSGVNRNIKFDLQLKVVVWDKSDAQLGAAYGFDWVSMSQSGNYIVGRKWQSDGVTADHCTVYDATGAVVTENAGTGSHPDMGYNSAGQEIISSTVDVAYNNMLTGVKTTAIPNWVAVFGANKHGGHTSDRNIDLPGWFFLGMSSLPSTTTTIGKNEIMAIKADGSGTVMRYGHDRGTSAGSRGSHACPNRNGTKVAFASDWGDSAGSYESYVLELIPTPLTRFAPNGSYNSVPTIPVLTMPAYQATINETANYNDGATRTYTRVADETAFGETSPTRLTHDYSKIPAWNCDDTLMVIGLKICNGAYGSNYGVLIDLAQSSIGVNYQWSYIDPSLMYYVTNNTLYKLVVNAGRTAVTRTALYNFQTLHGYTTVKIGPDEGRMSEDDKYVILNVVDGTGERLMIKFNIQTLTREIIKTHSEMGLQDPGTGTAWGTPNVNWISISPSGNYVAARIMDAADSHILFDGNLNFIRNIGAGISHGGFGYDQAGNEVFTSAIPCGYRKLSDNSLTTLLTTAQMSAYNPGSASNGAHASSAWRRRGWLYFSLRENNREMLALKMDNSGIVERLGFSHDTGTGYDNETQICPSNYGDQWLFKSLWEGQTKTYSYVGRVVPH